MGFPRLLDLSFLRTSGPITTPSTKVVSFSFKLFSLLPNIQQEKFSAIRGTDDDDDGDDDDDDDYYYYYYYYYYYCYYYYYYYYYSASEKHQCKYKNLCACLQLYQAVGRCLLKTTNRQK